MQQGKPVLEQKQAIIYNRAEQSRTEQNRGEQSRTEQDKKKGPEYNRINKLKFKMCKRKRRHFITLFQNSYTLRIITKITNNQNE